MYMYEIDEFECLAREETGGRKSCSDYIFIKKSLKDCWTVIIIDLEKNAKQNIAAIKPAKQTLKCPLLYGLFGVSE